MRETMEPEVAGGAWLGRSGDDAPAFGADCGRPALAAKAAALVDAAAYFARLDEALATARRSILIVGWDFDGRIRLRHDDAGTELGPRLRALVEAAPLLEVRILVWSIAVLHAPGASLPLLFGADWQDHPRIRLVLDDRHPIYAAHHQKLVTVDDRLAFVGGIDLTIGRWDSPAHRVDDPGRRNPDGAAYPPVHDVQLMLAGPAARTVADLGRDRWRWATGETLAPVPALDAPDPWPLDLAADFADAPVVVARGAPAWADAPAAAEVGAMLRATIAAARRWLYIETQYLSARRIGDLLARRLAEPEGPEIVIVASRSAPGLVERFVMGSNRDRLVRRLRRSDRHGRLRVCYPVVPGAGPDAAPTDCPIFVHAKLMIADDRILKVGSSNLNNRSFGLDTECDVGIAGGGAEIRAGIRSVLARLLAEHLGAAPAAVAARLEATGSLLRTIDALGGAGRRLEPFPDLGRGPTRPVPGTWLLDPRRPFEPLWFLRRKKARAPRAGTAPATR